MQSEFSKELQPFYEKLKPFMDDFKKIPIDEGNVNTFMTCTKASFIKCFEFNYNLCNKDFSNESFYLMPFLRGICEDIITLKFLHNIEEATRNKIVTTFAIFLQLESMHSQGKFFSAESIIEPVLTAKEKTIEDVKDELKAVWKSLGHNKDKIFPSVEHMAIDTRMKGLYDYLYHATSRAVHFSPNHLMRTGWGDDESGTYTFSMKNFTSYYEQFLIFYSSYLFLKFTKEFKKILSLNNDFLKIVKQMKFIFRHLPHCPEIVTYEEMNKKRPFKIISILADKNKRFKDSI